MVKSNTDADNVGRGVKVVKTGGRDERDLKSKALFALTTAIENMLTCSG